jgi:isopropylmalate/homocitrate/citramalate synthase
MAQPWKTKDWYVSPWNFLDEVTKEFSFPDEIKMHDVTLRDGEQQAGVEFDEDDKVRIAEKLAEVGVHRIEAGMPAVSPQDEAAIKEIVKRDLPSEIFAFCRCMVSDVQLAADCGVDGVIVEIPSSRHLIQHAYQWPLERAIEASIKATSFAKEQGLYTTFFTIDATREDMDWLLSLIDKVAAEGHMDALVLVDTMGVASPEALAHYTRVVKSRIDKPLEAHFHNDFGMGVANTIAALSNGASVAHVTVSGMGERSGNASLEDVAVALRVLYDIDLGMKYDKFKELSELLVQMSGHRLPANKSIVGENLFTIESGIVAAWQQICKGDLATEVFPLHWDFLGHAAPEIVLGKGSGRPSIEYWLEKIGKDGDVPQEQVDELLMKVKSKALEVKRLLTEDEFRELADEVVG